MTALEEFTAHHAERVEDIMYRWPWRRFEAMFRLHLLRKARDELRQMRDLRLAALDANTNYDSEENRNVKSQRASSLQEVYEEAVRILYSKPSADGQDETEEDPLFAPIKRRASQMKQEIDQPLVAEAGMGRELLAAT